jgi:hypothetical protein
MNFKIPIRVLATLILMLMLMLQACGKINVPLPSATATPTLEPTPTQPEAAQATEPQSTESALCSNPLFPVKSGATWTYNSTGSLSGNFNFTDTISAVREDGFTLASQVDGSSLSQDWTCTPDGLVSQTFGGGAIGGISTSGVKMSLTTSNVQGVIVPKTVSANDEWSYSLDFTGEMEYSGTTVGTDGSATFNFNALGEESVTVPAGTFTAMKVHVDLKLEMDVTYFGFSAPAVFSIPSDIWYAPGVGWVKATSAGDMFGMAFNETIELQSYNIP